MKLSHFLAVAFFSAMTVLVLMNMGELSQFRFLNFKSKTEILRLSFVGDFLIHKDIVDASVDNETGAYEFDGFFKYVKSKLTDADFTIGNLEVTLGTEPFSGYPRFSSPRAFAETLKRIGVDAVTTANNHAMDKRNDGVHRTLAILDELQLKHTGTFMNENSKRPIILNKNGIRIAILSYTLYDESAHILRPRFPVVMNYLDKHTIRTDIETTNELKPDLIIACMHVGEEYETIQGILQEDWVKYFKDLGVKVVIGGHPHILQPMKWNKNDGSLVVYSLGSIISHQFKEFTDGGAILRLTIEKTPGGDAGIKHASYDLTWVYKPIVDGMKRFYVLPANEFVGRPEFFASGYYNDFINFVNKTRKRLADVNVNISET